MISKRLFCRFRRGLFQYGGAHERVFLYLYRMKFVGVLAHLFERICDMFHHAAFRKKEVLFDEYDFRTYLLGHRTVDMTHTEPA